VLAVLAAVAGLYIVALLLWSAAGLHHVARRTSELELSAVQQQGSAAWLIKGRAPAGSLLEVGAGTTVLGRPVQEPDGSFEQSIEPRPWARNVWVRALSAGSAIPIRAEVPLSWRRSSFAPTLDTCAYFESARLLWIAGRATAHDSFSIKTALPDGPARIAIADDSGIVDALVPVDDASLIGDVHLAPILGVRSPPVACSVVSDTDAPPLVRTAVLNEPDIVDRFASAQAQAPESNEALAQGIEEMLPPATFSVTLPAAHPLVRYFADGGITAFEFLQGSVGSLDVIADDQVFETLRAQLTGLQPGLRLPETFRTRSRIRIQNQLATVEVTTRSFSAYLTGRVQLSPGIGNGIASRPLLTSFDRLTIRAGAGWRYHAVPSEIDNDAATWSGPSTLEPAASPPISITEFPQVLATVARQNTPGGATSLNAFLAEFETARQQSLAARVWRTMLVLIPLLAFWWIVRAELVPCRRRGPLSAVSVVFAVALCWRHLLDAINDVMPPLMADMESSALLVVGTVAPTPASMEGIAVALGNATGVAFWIVMLTLIGLLPLYFATLADFFSSPPDDGHDPAVPAARTIRTRIRSAITVGRVVVTASVVVLVFASAHAALRPEVQPFLDQHVFTTGAWQQIARTEALVLDASRFHGLLVPILWVFLTFCFGLRGIVFGLTCTSALWYVYTRGHTAAGDIVVGAVALSSVPLLVQVLRRIVPGRTRTRSLTIVALAFALACAYGVRAPGLWFLAAAAGLVGVGFLWITLSHVGSRDIFAALRGWMNGFLPEGVAPFASIALLAFAGILIGWPSAGPDGRLQVTDASLLLDQWSGIFAPVLGLALAFVLWEYMAARRSQVLDDRALLAGMIFYAAFLIGSTSTWLFVPVPFLVALLIARHWLFKGAKDRDPLRSSGELAPPPDPGVLHYVETQSLRSSVDAAIASLRADFQKAQVVPEEFTKRLAAYREFERTIAVGPTAATIPPFAVGQRDFPRNVVAFIEFGLLLAAVPLCISLYEYLPVSRVSYPFPIAGFLSFVVVATLKWGLFAAFFGLLYPNLRGDSGLAKGVLLFVVLATPFALPYLLGAPSLDAVRTFSLWLAQLFVFCSLLGLLAGDVRLLRENGLRVRDLQVVHRMPVLSALASTVAAAVVPTILTVVAGEIGDVVKVFIDLVRPSGTP
jgi:hypothetical protein